MNAIQTILILSILCEAILENVKLTFSEGKLKWGMIFSIIISSSITILCKQDIFSLVGYTFQLPFIGEILTGIIISRGSNAFHEIIKKITK